VRRFIGIKTCSNSLFFFRAKDDADLIGCGIAIDGCKAERNNSKRTSIQRKLRDI
jgi:hypothetical protein